MTYLNDVRTRNKNAAQSEPYSEDQVKNHAGGYVFKVDKWDALDRFLILGTVGGTYYVSQKQATQESLVEIKACIAEDAERVVARIVEISDAGRAIKNDPAILVLALCLTHADDKASAVKAVPKVCRIGTHILTLAAYLDGLRGWGRVAKKAIREWFYSKRTEELAYQAVKYKSRNGWSLRDLMRLAHMPLPEDVNRRSVMAYIAHPELKEPSVSVIEAERKAHESPEDIPELIREYNLPREALPTEALNDAEVWRALLEKMPMTALIRNLGKLSAIDLTRPMSKESRYVAQRLTDRRQLSKGRIHPLSLLMAYSQYKKGCGLRGSLSWTVSQEIKNALEEAYYLSFNYLQPTGKRYYVGVDVSGSMGWGTVAGTTISPAQGATCLASVLTAQEEYTYVAGFCDVMKPLNIPKRGLDCGLESMAFGRTDCALPMLDALDKGIEADVFVVLTDNETWCGGIHPVRALKEYRRKTGIDAKLIVVAMTSTGFSIADPKDPGMLDVVGFDANIPQLISEFS